MKDYKEMIRENRGMSSFEFSVAIVLLIVVGLVLSPTVIRIIDNAQKNTDFNNANHLVQVTIQASIFDERFYGFKGEIDLNDSEISDIEVAILSRLNIFPKIKSRPDCHFIIHVSSLGDIQVMDNRNRMIYPLPDQIYMRN